FSSKGSVQRVRPVRSAAGGMRRVMVKVRVVRMTPGARKALMTHVRYVARDVAGAEGEQGRFFSAQEDEADAVAFAGRCEGDRHHFRLIVNPEDGRELPDLKGFTRRFMEQVETDMGTPLDWVAGAHYDTGRPHLHILLRGKRDDGRDLVLPRDYVSHGLRRRSQELATEILGPRQERAASDRDVTADRFTRLDQVLIGEVRDGRLTLDGLPETQRSDALRRLVQP
ncbi:MAG: relaxase/mobilization nuclease RlxS, partial [Brevundimonas sp.]